MDNSHGAHFAFLDGYSHPLDSGADMVCDSLHKVLPAFTGSALLHVNTLNYKKAKKAMKQFCSSSPSYLIMLSTAIALNWAEKNARYEYNSTAKRVSQVKERLSSDGYLIPDCEPLRIYIKGNGKEINRLLEQNGCKTEFYDEDGVLLMFSPSNTPEDFEKITKALIGIDIAKKLPSINTISDILPIRKMTLNKAFYSDYEVVPITDSVGRVAAECLGKYPPGIPKALMGEVITKECLYGVTQLQVSVVKNV